MIYYKGQTMEDVKGYCCRFVCDVSVRMKYIWWVVTNTTVWKDSLILKPKFRAPIILYDRGWWCKQRKIPQNWTNGYSTRHEISENKTKDKHQTPKSYPAFYMHLSPHYPLFEGLRREPPILTAAPGLTPERLYIIPNPNPQRGPVRLSPEIPPPHLHASFALVFSRR